MIDTALVTGGSGFVALEIIQQLLAGGCRVRATVRDLRKEPKVRPLKRLQTQFPERLQIFEANLLSSRSFDPAMQGCTVVYHVASPFLLPEQIFGDYIDVYQMIGETLTEEYFNTSSTLETYP